MIIIDYYRFAPAPDKCGTTDGQDTCAFRTIFFKSNHYTGNESTVADVYGQAQIWLKDHYGYCVIHQDNLDDSDMPIDIKVSNRLKLVEDFSKMGALVKIFRLK